MAASKFTPEITGRFVEKVRAGLSYRDAAREAGVREKTVKSWLTRGRKESEGRYCEFASAVDEAKSDAESVEAPGTEAELRLVTWRAAQEGSVQAMKLYFDMIRRDEPDTEDDDPFSDLGSPVGE